MSIPYENLDLKILCFFIVLLNVIINNPLIVDGGFSEEYLKIEKEILKDSIMGIINDKGT